MKKKGFTLIELLVVIAIIALLMGILMPALNKARQLAIQLICGTNLKGLSAAMLVYASYCDNDYPRAGGPGSTWTDVGIIQEWIGGRSGTEDEAFGTVRETGIMSTAPGDVLTPGQATVTSSFYLLVKHAKVSPKQFVCKGDTGTSVWRFTDYDSAVRIDMDMTRAWDFGDGSRMGGRHGPQLPYPGEVVSYTYQFPYSTGGVETFVLVDMSNPGSPVCADRNPYTDKNAPEPPDDISEYNSASHYNKGQNVMYKDGHVKFEARANVGISDDNIYTYRVTDTEDAAVGMAPDGDGDPAAFSLDESDALLVSERNGRSP
ncbi:MAG: type II secretion system protein [Planctomycetota bacterium]|jgi:prepilin-type N-terminal cleavage/methylation domain-containing protein